MFDLPTRDCNKYPGTTKCQKGCEKGTCFSQLNFLELAKKIEDTKGEKICAGRPLNMAYINKAMKENISLYNQSQRV